MLAVEHADKFEDVGDGDEPERGASSGRGRVAVVMVSLARASGRRERAVAMLSTASRGESFMVKVPDGIPDGCAALLIAVYD